MEMDGYNNGHITKAQTGPPPTVAQPLYASADVPPVHR